MIIEDSMYVSGLKENVPDSVLMDLAYINGWDIDFTMTQEKVIVTA